MTDKEKALVEMLGECYNQFVELDDKHHCDDTEFAQAIHMLQRQVMCRLARRQHPQFFFSPENGHD